MNIGIDARSLLEPCPSGVSYYTYQLVAELLKLQSKDQFKLFISGNRAKHIEHTLLALLLEHYPNLSVHHLRLPSKLFHAQALVGQVLTIDQWLGDIQVLFAPNWHFLPLTSKIPLVLTAHDLGHQLYPEFLSLRRLLWHKAVRPQYLLRRASKLITVSETTRTTLLTHYQLSAAKVVTIHSAPLPEQSSEATLAILPKLPTRYALVLSTIEPRKNIVAVVQAFQLFKQRYPKQSLELIIAGSAGWKSNKVLRQINSVPYFHYYGYVTAAQKQALLAQARYLIYPSIYEGFGLPPLEALCLNVPVIASQAGALPEILQNAAYYVDPYSVTDLATACWALETDAVLRQQLLTYAQTLLPSYDWITTAKRTLQVLHEAAYTN